MAKQKVTPPLKKDKTIKRRKPTQKRAKNTVELILNATKELVQQEGYQGLTTNKIAEKAGISVGSLYQYFPSREFIAYDLYENTLEKLANKISAETIDIIQEDTQTAIPELMTDLLQMYRADELILIKLLEEVPELWSKTRNFSLEQLMREANLAYFSFHQADKNPIAVKKNLFFVSTVILESVRKYLSEKPDYLSDEEFISKLSKLIIFSLESL